MSIAIQNIVDFCTKLYILLRDSHERSEYSRAFLVEFA